MKTINFGSGDIPWLDMPNNFEAKDHTVHFSPANGLPMGSYGEFFDLINQNFRITSMDNRGAWPNSTTPPKRWDWDDHTNDLIAAIESQHNYPVIGMGHSLGGTITAMAASKRPDLFSCIVLIDPASLPTRALSILYPFFPQWLVFKLVPFIRSTYHRRNIWPSPEAFIDHYRQRRTYQHLTERSFQNYAEHGLTIRDDGQYQLTYPPAWEAHNFQQAPYLWTQLPKVKTPALVLRAELTHLYSASDFDSRNKAMNNPNIESQTIPQSYHLAPLEEPAITADMCLEWLKSYFS